ncbi:MAG: hypothetical protein HQL91_14000 [Magnetococcales bacterium]|nr:hypothetical protein [Magnetococcales bacterium]MBF0629323.1 hypothetical protein [Magnetococcales bacterium]
MIQIHSSQQVHVTPELAGDWLQHNIFSRQRAMRPRHRDTLVQEIQAGRFIQGTQIHFVRFRNEQLLVNGQHTLAAIEKSGLPVTLTVLISDAETMDEVAELYSRHDNHLSRSIIDAIKARDLHNQIGMSLKQAMHVAAALRFIQGGFRRSDSGSSREDVLTEIRDWEEEGNAFFETIHRTGNDSMLLLKAAVLSIGLITFRHQEGKAREFWRQVALDDGLRMNDPRKILHEFIELTRVKQGPFIRGGNVVTSAYVARATAVAWNAFFSGTPLTRINVPDPNREMFIKGTPYKGMQNA